MAQPLPRSQTFYVGRQAMLSVSLSFSPFALPMPRQVGLACSGELRSRVLPPITPFSPFSPLSPFTTFRIRRGNSDSISLEGTMRSNECLYVRDSEYRSQNRSTDLFSLPFRIFFFIKNVYKDTYFFYIENILSYFFVVKSWTNLSAINRSLMVY